jgi:hypothetical protein
MSGNPETLPCTINSYHERALAIALAIASLLADD